MEQLSEIIDDAGSIARPQIAGSVPDTPVAVTWRRRSWLTKWVFSCVLLTAITVFLWPSRYQSTMRILAPSNTNSMLAAAASKLDAVGAGGLSGELLGARNQGALYVPILRSRSVQDAIIHKHELQKVYFDRYLLDARKDLANFTEIDEDRKNGVVTVTVTDRDARRAAAIALSYVDELNRVSADMNTTAAHRERLFLEQRLAEVKRDLDDASEQLAQFSSKNLTLDVKDQGKAMVQAGAELQGSLIAAESELAGLQQIYTGNNARVQSAQARVSELRRELKNMSGSGNVDSGQVYPSMRKLPLLGVAYADLFRRVKIQESVFEMLTRQYELAKVEEAKEMPVVRVLDAPDIAERRHSPKRLTIIAISFLLALGFGFLLVFVDEYWRTLDVDDPKKRSARDLFAILERLLPSRFSRLKWSQR